MIWLDVRVGSGPAISGFSAEMLSSVDLIPKAEVGTDDW
jgi:hypothetical protein